MSNDVLKLHKQVCFPLYVLSREVIQRYRPMLEELGVTYPQYLVMLVLWENKKQTVNQLGEKLRLDSGTLTPLLKRLQQKGFINRTRSSTDERVVEISLTPAGAALEKEAESIPGKLVDALDFNIDELKQLQFIVNKILNKIKE